MKKLTFSVIVIALAFGCPLKTFAQNDSSWLDAGTLKLKKAFTQTISIKGADLEKMPFANLSEAIGAWLYGVYSNALTLSYVVDGIPVSDVNAWSIYDIEEIVFVQNALSKINGAPGQGQMVLITTKKKTAGSKGITVAAQTGLVRQNFGQFYPGSGIGSKTDVYDQFYAGLNRNEKNIDYGLSADYLRDVMPSAKADSIQSASSFTLSRLRLNGYLDLRLGAKNRLSLQINYTPQTMDSAQHFLGNSNALELNGSNDAVTASESTHQHQYSWSPRLGWQTRFSDKWSNEVQAVYLSYGARVGDQLNAADPADPNLGQNVLSLGNGNQYSKHVFARERLSYETTAGGWIINPSLNLSYEHIADDKSGNSFYSDSVGTSSFPGGVYLTRGTQYFLTPSIDIGYEQILDLQAGVLVNLSSQHFTEGSIDRSFPFASVSADLEKALNKNARSSLKLFGSYAKMTDLANDDFSLPDLSYGAALATSHNLAVSGPFLGAGIPGAYLPGYIPFIASHASSVLEAGAGFSTPGGRLQINYHFEKTDFLSPYIIQGFLPQGSVSNGSGYYALNAYSQVLGILLNILEGGKKALGWQSVFNISTARLTLNHQYAFLSPYLETGDLIGNGPSWTGGWTNSLRYMNFSMGMNFLYHFHEYSDRDNLYAFTGVPPTRINSLVLQNVYLAYRLGRPGGGGIEFYLDSRNLFQSSGSDVTDGRRFYGVGGKIGL
jgi:hypothetical protein